MYITLEALREHDACADGIDAFIETFGQEAAEKGVALTRANIEKMPHSQLWAAYNLEYSGWLEAEGGLYFFERGRCVGDWYGPQRWTYIELDGTWRHRSSARTLSRRAFIAAVRAARQRPSRAVPKRRPAGRRVRGSEA